MKWLFSVSTAKIFTTANHILNLKSTIEKHKILFQQVNVIYKNGEGYRLIIIYLLSR